MTVVPLASPARSRCIECDALPGACSHRGHRYLDPIRYEPVEVEEGQLPRWAVPIRERARFDAPTSSWAWKEAARPSDDPNANPFHCRGCSAPLSAWARVRGFAFCSASCRIAHQ